MDKDIVSLTEDRQLETTHQAYLHPTPVSFLLSSLPTMKLLKLKLGLIDAQSFSEFSKEMDSTHYQHLTKLSHRKEAFIMGCRWELVAL